MYDFLFFFLFNFLISFFISSVFLAFCFLASKLGGLFRRQIQVGRSLKLEPCLFEKHAKLSFAGDYP